MRFWRRWAWRCSYGFWRRVDWSPDAGVSEKHAHILSPDDTDSTWFLQNAGIYRSTWHENPQEHHQKTQLTVLDLKLSRLEFNVWLRLSGVRNVECWVSHRFRKLRTCSPIGQHNGLPLNKSQSSNPTHHLLLPAPCKASKNAQPLYTRPEDGNYVHSPWRRQLCLTKRWIILKHSTELISENRNYTYRTVTFGQAMIGMSFHQGKIEVYLLISRCGNIIRLTSWFSDVAKFAVFATNTSLPTI
jgi:hypothetical protein